MIFFSRLLVVPFLLLSLAGCASSQETEDGDTPRRERARPSTTQGIDLGLALPSPEIRSIQLYPHAPRAQSERDRDREDQLPVLQLRPAGDVTQLKLEFDLMERAGRPLSVYFYHANRSWRRDLFASEYLTSFQRDDLLDYATSVGTQVPYVHYSYTFPSDNMGFRISGNYVLRVTEQGREDEVLFEMPFFITETATPSQLLLDDVFVSGQRFPSVQPLLTFTPPSSLAGNVFDYNVCFVRNTLFNQARCTDDASLTQQPDLLFYLQPERSFEPIASDYVLDLRDLRPGDDIVTVNFTTVPYEVELDTDYARFPATSIEPFLNGQPVISNAVRDVAEPDLFGEYVEARFRFVPPNEQQLPGGIFLAGSFNGWILDLGNELRWEAVDGHYEGTLLMKQGMYEYRYTSPNRQTRSALHNNLPRTANQYTAFVYFSDVHLNTDRLLAIQATRTQ